MLLEPANYQPQLVREIRVNHFNEISNLRLQPRRDFYDSFVVAELGAEHAPKGIVGKEPCRLHRTRVFLVLPFFDVGNYKG